MGSQLAERVAVFASRHRLFSAGETVGVAVSGGADSVCLLHVLVELAPCFGIRLAVAHLNHKLRRAESDADASFVRDLAGRLALPFHCRDADVAGTGGNLEQAGRQARLDFFRGLISIGAADRIATGHTRNDQAETVLFRFLRGSGTAGLCGILPVTPDGLVRPLLDTERSDVEAWLRERDLTWREDSSNRDPAFARNRIRHDLLPALAQDWNPRLTQTLASTASISQDEEDYWRGRMGDLIKTLAARDGPAVILPVDALNELPRAVRRRLMRRAFELVRGDLRGIEFVHIEAALALVERPDGSGRVQVPGVDVFRSFDWVRLGEPAAIAGPRDAGSARARNWSLDVTAPGRYRIPGRKSHVCFDLAVSGPTGEAGGYNGDVSELDWERVRGDVRLRNWRPGDQYRPAGVSAGKKVKLLFQEHRIPLWERRDWPMVTTGEQIAWTRRFGPAGEFAAGPASRVILRITEDFIDPTESQDESATSDKVRGPTTSPPASREL